MLCGVGVCSDKLGRRHFFLLSTIVQTIALALMVHFVRSKTFSGWLVCFLTIGSLYGAWFISSWHTLAAGCDDRPPFGSRSCIYTCCVVALLSVAACG
jgi:hypothetical protein